MTLTELIGVLSSLDVSLLRLSLSDEQAVDEPDESLLVLLTEFAGVLSLSMLLLSEAKTVSLPVDISLSLVPVLFDP